MNKKNETYSDIDINTDISNFNNKYHSSLNHNYTYYTLDTSLFANTNDKFYSNLKKDFKRNIFGRNYIYNQKKVISLHKNKQNNKSKLWKIFDIGKFSKNMNLLHRNELRNKLLESKLYKLIEKTANDNYLKAKRKKNMFITTIEEDNNYEEEENNKTKKIFNKMNNNKKIRLNINPSFFHNESENKKNPLNLNTYYNNINDNISLNQSKHKKNKSLNVYNLSDISLPCITFNNSLNSLNTSSNHKNSLAQICLAKLRVEVINKTLHENYKKFYEKRDFPISLSDALIRLYLKNQKYYYIFDDLTKKYMLSLTNEIGDNILTLSKLIKQKEDLVKINEEKLKKISALEEKIKIYESFNNLYLSLKNKTKSPVSPHSTRKSPTKSKKISLRQSTEFFKKNSIFRKGNEFFNKRISHMKTITNQRSPVRKQRTSIESPKKARELFKNTQEIQEIFEEREKKVFLVYKKYIDLIYDTNKLSLENQNEKAKNKITPEIKENNLIFEKSKNELILLKLRNKELKNYKNALNKSKKNEENIDFMNNKKREKNKESKILKKLKEIIFYHKINIDKISGLKKMFQILEEKEYNDCIIYKGKTYTKEIFYLQILEYIFLKMEEWKNKCLSDKNLREKYIKIKNERDKEMKYLKCEQNLMEEKMNTMKKNYEIMNKNNKIIVVSKRKFDPFYKKYMKDEIEQKRKKSLEDFDKKKQNDQIDKYNDYLYY